MTLLLLLLSISAGDTATARAGWRGIYDDAPIALRIHPDRARYRVGDTFRIVLTAWNTSDRPVEMRRDWREQVSYYHLHPATGQQIEWPGRVCNAARVEAADVLRLRPGERYSVTRAIRLFSADDVAEFQFRVKLWGVRDLNCRFSLWEGQVWSNSVRVTVRR